MLGIEGEYPATHSENIFWQNCKKSTVKHSLGKFILSNLVNLAKIFFPRLSITFILLCEQEAEILSTDPFQRKFKHSKNCTKTFQCNDFLEQEKVISQKRSCSLLRTCKISIFRFWSRTIFQHSSKTVSSEYIMFMWKFGSHWLASVCNTLKSQSTKWARMWLLLILTVNKRWLAMCQRMSLWLHLRFYSCPTGLWTSC